MNFKSHILIFASLLFCLLFSGVSNAVTYTVTNCADTDTVGTLRWAINQANATTESEVAINFGITLANSGYSSGAQVAGLVTTEAGSDYWFRIPVNALPAITKNSLTIDATTQGNEANNTRGPKVQIVSTLNGTNGFNIQANYVTIKGFAITNFVSGSGVIINGNYTGNIVVENYIGGITPTGESSGGFSTYGVYLAGGANRNIIGGSSAMGLGNVISGGGSYDLYITGSGTNSNEVLGNIIGLNSSGTAKIYVQAYAGVYILGGAKYNKIGGGDGVTENTICGYNWSSAYSGVWIAGTGTDSNEVLGNYIGTTPMSGSISNGRGISILEGAQYNKIGNGTANGTNIISRNTTGEVMILAQSSGIYLGGSNTKYNSIIGNYIGSGPTGQSATPNRYGIIIDDNASYNYIGDGTSGGRNIISGNTYSGIRIASSAYNQIRGNYIGTKLDGESSLPNGTQGVEIVNFLASVPYASYNSIGGRNSGDGNVISGNSGSGILINGIYCPSNEVYGNFIGLTASGEGSLGNTGVGIDISSSFSNIIGAGNNIAYNYSILGGLYIGGEDAKYNSISASNIYSNNGKEINLNSGANSGILRPVITSAGYYSVSDRYGFSGTSEAYATVEVFKVEDEDPLEYGGSNLFLGTTIADGSGNWYFTTTEGVAASDKVTAIQTSTSLDSSEFAQNLVVSSISDVITVEAPNGGEIIQGNNYSTILWTSEGSVSDVKIYYSTNAGSSYTLITQEANDGLYTWEAANVATSQARIKIEDASNPLLYDESNANFTIVTGPKRFRVTKTTDEATEGTLRWAIEGANATNEASLIQFNIPASDDGFITQGSNNWWRITPVTSLPAITADNLTINGFTQPTSEGDNAEGPEIEIFGNGSAFDGLYVTGSGNLIEGLTIGGFSGTGKSGIVLWQGNGQNKVKGCYLGTTPTGEAVNGNYYGVYIRNCTENIIGSTESTMKNLISGNTNRGIYVMGSAGINTIIGNYIGTDKDGNTSLGNLHGIYVSYASMVRIGGNSSSYRNVISGNTGNGIQLGLGSTSAEVMGNYIGVQADGQSALGNTQWGIYMTATNVGDNTYHIIGSTESGGKNVISSNYAGINVSNSSSNRILGNYIGVSASGFNDLGNTHDGISMSESSYNNISGNVVAGNTERGIDISYGIGNNILGNYVGVDPDGSSSSIGNGQDGIYLDGSTANYIGDGTVLGRNIVSNNGLSGVVISGTATNNRILGNYIGTKPDGLSPLGNNTGVWLEGNGVNVKLGNYVGDGTDGGRNVISGNNNQGIVITDCDGNYIYGNYIGTDSNGENPLPNGDEGILIESYISSAVGSASNEVGGINKGNLIAFNSQEAVLVSGEKSFHNLISQNSMYDNLSYGISLEGGANQGKTPPIISSAGKYHGSGYYRIYGTSEANGTIEVFVASPEASGYGEGKRYVGTAYSNDSGNWNFSTSEVLSLGDEVTATYTDSLKNTSSFSENKTINMFVSMITVEAPNGGETIEALSSYQISWTSESVSSGVNIYYSLNGGISYIPVATNEANLGSYSWPVPNNPTTEGKIKVESYADPLVYDESDDVFTISPVRAITLEAPNGSEKWIGGTSHNISWTSAGYIPNVKIMYSTNGWLSSTVITQEVENTGTYSWTVPEITTDRASVRVEDSTSSGVYDVSTSTFIIDSTNPLVTVEAPNGGEFLKGGVSAMVAWSATHEVGLKNNPIKIYLTTNEGSSWTNLADGIANISPDYFLMPSINSSQCRVSVEAEDVAGLKGYGISENTFTIDSNPPTAPTAMTPYDGEVLQDNTPTLTWEASTDNLSGIASYEINLSGTLITIDASTSYAVSSPLSEGAQTFKVRAKDGAGNWGSYGNMNSFNVDTIPPSATSIILKDRTVGSTLETNDRVVSLEASGVSGTPAYMIVSENADFAGGEWVSYLNPSTFELSDTVGTKTAYYKLKDLAGNVSSTLDASIYLDTRTPVITLESPTGGESLESLSQFTISYSDLGIIDNVKIYYSIDSGDSYTLITNEVNSGTYLWTIPSNSTTEAKIKVEDASNASIYDESDNFAIYPRRPRIEVTNTLTTVDDVGSFIWAIDQVNSTTEANPIITFNIPSSDSGRTTEGGATFFRINVSGYSQIDKEGVIIDGFTQPTSEGNNPYGPEIELRGNSSSGSIISLNSSGNTVRGLILNGKSSGAGISTSYSGNNIYGCYIGTDATGESAVPNQYGIYLPSSTGTIIGTLEPGLGNIISGNSNYGIMGGESIEVYGNIIGANRTATRAIPNSTGIFVYASSYNKIGSTTAAGRNIISGNTNAGISINGIGNNTYNEIYGNYVGVNYNATSAIPNGTGINISGLGNGYNKVGDGTEGGRNIISGNTGTGLYIAGTSSEVLGNYIGVSLSGGDLGNGGYGLNAGGLTYSQIGDIDKGNTIANNGIYGVYLSSSTSTYNTIRGNSFYDNNYLAIKLASGSNQNILSPQISYAAYYSGLSNYKVVGTSTPDAIIEVYLASGEVSASGEGRVSLGTTESDSSGNWEFTTTSGISVGDIVTATQTDLFGDTSEFSTNAEVGVGGGTITLGTPSGGETIEGNSVYNITWESTGGFPGVKIYYSIDGGTSYSLITQEANDGNYLWNVPNIATSEASIKIANASDPDVSSESSSFSIIIQRTITISVPNGGEIYDVSTAQNISWESTGDITEVNIYYSNNNGASYQLVTTEVNDGAYLWNLPSSPTTEAKIKIAKSDELSIYDASYQKFTITEPRTLAIKTPNGGETWEAGTYNLITWESSGYVFNVNIYCSVNGSYNLVTQEANDGSYLWRTNATPTTEAKIKIVDSLDTSVSSESLNYFSIVDTTGPVVTVDAPASGNILTGGATYEITWRAEDAVLMKSNPITIFFSSNEGSSWSTVTSEVSNSGSYIWNVPQINSIKCKISIEAEDVYSNIGRGISQGNFIIAYNPIKPAVSFEVLVPSTGLVENKPFIVTVEALDVNGNKTSGVSQNVSVILSQGEASPETISYLEFLDGEWEGVLSVSKAGDITLTFASGSVLGTAEVLVKNERKEFSNPALGVTIVVPEGASTREVVISVLQEPTPPGPTPSGYLIASNLYNMTGTVSNFDIPISITISVESGLVNPKVLFWDGSKWSNEGIVVVSYSGTTLTFTTTHLTVFSAFSVAANNLVRFGPNPYNPSNGNAKFWYWLTSAGDTSIYIVDITGNIVAKRSYSSGINGGKLGENNVEFDGKNSSGSVLGDGVYLYKVIQGSKVVGGGKIAIIK